VLRDIGADELAHEALHGIARFRVIDRGRRERASMAPDDQPFAVPLHSRQSAKLIQELTGRLGARPERAARSRSLRQELAAHIAHDGVELHGGKPIGQHVEELGQHRNICVRHSLLGFARQLVHMSRFSPAAPQASPDDGSVPLENREL